MNKLNITKKFLENEYYKNKKTLTQIAKELNCNPCSLTRYMKKYNLKHCSHEKIFYCVNNCGKEVSRSGNRCIECWGKEYSLRQEKGNNSCFRHGKYIKGTKYYCIQKDCKNEVSRPDVNCLSCSNKINMKKWWANENNKKRTIEKRIKMGTFKLEKNPRWLNGKSFEPYPTGWNKILKDEIRFKNKYECQLCSKSEIKNSKNLCIHHIDYNKSNIEKDNLISLCHSCHSKTNSNREYWTEYFKNLTGGLCNIQS